MHFELKESFHIQKDKGPSVDRRSSITPLFIKQESFIAGIYSAETNRKIVCEYNLIGEFIRQIGRTGLNPGEYIDPTHIAIDSSENVYVYDGTCSGTDTINSYDRAGTLIDCVNREDCLPYIGGLLFDREGNLLHLSRHPDPVELRKYRKQDWTNGPM